jgi:hypothetical protein
LSATLDRRGEAHLWLVLEDALASARDAHARGDVDRGVWDARRRFASVASVLVDVGAIGERRAEGIIAELDDALALRGVMRSTAFRGDRLAPWDEPPLVTTARRSGDGWLEAEIEHHLNLIVDLQPRDNADVGHQLLDNLAPQVRALHAVGSLRSRSRLDDLAATLAAVGYGVEGITDASIDPGAGDVDKGWLSFLRARPRLIHVDDEPAASRTVNLQLGEADGPVVLERLAWSTDVLVLEVKTPATSSQFWRASAFDDSGQLHVGHPGQRVTASSGAPTVFRLRPGLRDTVRSLWVRVTHKASRVEEQVML